MVAQAYSLFPCSSSPITLSGSVTIMTNQKPFYSQTAHSNLPYEIRWFTAVFNLGAVSERLEHTYSDCWYNARATIDRYVHFKSTRTHDIVSHRF